MEQISPCVQRSNYFCHGLTLLTISKLLLVRKDYLTEATTNRPDLHLQCQRVQKKPVGCPRKAATTNQSMNFGHISSSRERQRPISDSEHKNRSSEANEHSKEDRLQQSCTQKEPMLELLQASWENTMSISWSLSNSCYNL